MSRDDSFELLPGVFVEAVGIAECSENCSVVGQLLVVRHREDGSQRSGQKLIVFSEELIQARRLKHLHRWQLYFQSAYQLLTNVIGLFFSKWEIPERTEAKQNVSEWVKVVQLFLRKPTTHSGAWHHVVLHKRGFLVCTCSGRQDSVEGIVKIQQNYRIFLEKTLFWPDRNLKLTSADREIHMLWSLMSACTMPMVWSSRRALIPWNPTDRTCFLLKHLPGALLRIWYRLWPSTESAERLLISLQN